MLIVDYILIGIIAIVLGFITYAAIFNENNGDGPASNDWIG